LSQETHNTATWPTTLGAVCIVVGGLSLFGGCLSLTGFAEIEQLHTAIPFGASEISEELLVKLDDTEPVRPISSIISGINILFSITLAIFGMWLLQQAPKARTALLWWAILYIPFTVAAVAINWLPRLDLVQENSEVQGMFLAQLLISIPLYLVLPVFLLIFLSNKKIRNKAGTWR
jgi:hypothetical protein